jgi:hypothetical protein
LGLRIGRKQGMQPCPAWVTKPESRISQVCRQEVERMQRALSLMDSGVIKTFEVRHGRRVDTTDETMDLYRASNC